MELAAEAAAEAFAAFLESANDTTPIDEAIDAINADFEAAPEREQVA